MATLVMSWIWPGPNLIVFFHRRRIKLFVYGKWAAINVLVFSNTMTIFNPVNENYSMSGSIDGKARIWGVTERQVIDWADVRDVVTAICYHPDGKGFIVGSVTSTCRFYGALDGNLQLTTVINFWGRKVLTCIINLNCICCADLFCNNFQLTIRH
ncbi:guanine nucleotide-binding protein subunit beta-like [Camellia sinensis]|uniref:guanine nucleotide-binding protein subunit beta-like n=1 Tax=Camellia sinensis TaxID=4442 RepID=UPI001036A52D|nr:guanine nucleotide-binding protein subunit beta-like [Camellia sinensis]XP_028072862.1 guanine nucleotide-binding protein subunit beta-like [Camellia sinensis]